MPSTPMNLLEDDLLLAFSTESGGKPPESTESLAARVERLERALHRSTREIESLKSELATLVGTVDDIGKNARRPIAWAPRPVSTARSRFVTAIAGIVFGLALGMTGHGCCGRAVVASLRPSIAAPATELRAGADPRRYRKPVSRRLAAATPAARAGDPQTDESRRTQPVQTAG